MPQRESVTIAGDYGRVSIFPVRKIARGHRRCKARPTSEVQAKLNERKRQNHFADLVHTNFVNGDYFMRLSYRDDKLPGSTEDAQKAIQNYFRRVKSKCKKKNLPAPKYLYVTERGAVGGRYHHHAFISCELSRDELEAIWGNGYANTRRIEYNENGAEGLVKYSLKSGVHRQDEDCEKVGYRTYSGSKNLVQPEYRQNDYRIRAKDAAYIDAHPDDLDYVQQMYPGWIVTKVEPTSRSGLDLPDKSPIPRAHFITIWMYRADTKLFGRRRN